MFRAYIITLFFISTSFYSYSQWNHQYSVGTYIWTPWPGSNATYNHGVHVSNDTAIHVMRQELSPSAIYLRVKSTFNCGLSDSISFTASSSFQGPLHSVGVYAINKQNSFFWQYCDNDRLKIKKTADGGLTWVNMPSHYLYVGGHGAFFSSDTSEFYVSYTIYSSNVDYWYIDKYKDGIYYHKIDSLTTPIGKLFFTDSLTGYGSTGKFIYKSISSGTNWYPIFTDSVRKIQDIYFLDSLIGYAACDSGLVLKTLDGGNSWLYLNSGFSRKLSSLYFIDNLTGFAAGDSGLIIKTIDGGITWNQEFSNATGNFTKIYFVNDSIGFASIGQMVYRTNLNSPVGIWSTENVANQKLNVFPNPNEGTFQLKIPESLRIQQSRIMIYDLTSRCVFVQSAEFGEELMTIKLPAHLKGIFQIIVSDKEKSASTRLVVY